MYQSRNRWKPKTQNTSNLYVGKYACRTLLGSRRGNTSRVRFVLSKIFCLPLSLLLRMERTLYPIWKSFKRRVTNMDTTDHRIFSRTFRAVIFVRFSFGDRHCFENRVKTYIRVMLWMHTRKSYLGALMISRTLPARRINSIISRPQTAVFWNYSVPVVFFPIFPLIIFRADSSSAAARIYLFYSPPLRTFPTRVRREKIHMNSSSVRDKFSDRLIWKYTRIHVSAPAHIIGVKVFP